MRVKSIMDRLALGGRRIVGSLSFAITKSCVLIIRDKIFPA